ncbi:MAG: DUF1553 domain-containing protein [Bacteroidota bacterium]
MKHLYPVLFGGYLLAVVCLLSCGPSLPEEVQQAYDALPATLHFNQHVKPILSDKCFACHGPDAAKREAGLRLDLAEAAYGELPESPGKQAISPGSLKHSELFHRILTEEADLTMPPPAFKVFLSPQEKATLIRWVEAGATYQPHWAFLPPTATGATRSQSESPIDAFILKALDSQGLSPSPEADRAILLRRLSLDLTGLPPSLAETRTFVSDSSPNAYEQQVDRLLASVHYGEKMATDWMDLARYADTYGYQVDRYRDMSPWRDWVISAFNQNMPYDQFVSWQLAGDLMPNPSREQRLATGFNRLHPQNMEGGIVDEEFRVEYVSDRVAVLGDGLMGMTLSCARCHDHKYDPISQREYYELFSYFNNQNETGQISWDKGVPVPAMALPTSRQERIINRLQQVERTQLAFLDSVSQSEKANIQTWVASQSGQSFASRSLPSGKVGHYRLESSPIRNALPPYQTGKMDREFSPREVPSFAAGKSGKGLLLDGDAWLDLPEMGVFKRNQAFTIGLWVNLPDSLGEGVIFHKNKGTRLHSYRGYHLYLKNFTKLEWVMAHTWPENAIIKHSLEDVPKNEWIHLAVRYDGSSTAAGTQLYLNGKELPTRIEKDQLTKDIIFHNLRDVIYVGPIEPNLQIGARWRGRGITGAKVDEIEVYERALTELEIQAWAGMPSAQPSEAEATEWYVKHRSEPYQAGLVRLSQTRAALVDSMEKVQEIMVMDEMDTARHSFVLNRGVYDEYGKRVFPNTPKSLLAFPDSLPKNRLGLAQWLFLPDHPLTARVAVNRYWQQYFGRGLVATPQDFGNQGALPSHPALLDWLAVEFRESGWDVKALQKVMVMSQAYRQQSFVSPELRERDPDNIWLTRGPSGRLSSEMMRDNALAASGLLNAQVGGESVRPYQPDGLWLMNGGKYVPDHGEALYRRSFYTIWKRSVPNPTLATFDQPDRSVCTVKRQQTNTPLQALVLLNDPTYVETAKVLGARIAQAPDVGRAIQTTYQALTGIPPNDQELALLQELQAQEYAVFIADPQKTEGWLTTGEQEIPSGIDPAMVASCAVVASVMLNSDAAITKR